MSAVYDVRRLWRRIKCDHRYEHQLKAAEVATKPFLCDDGVGVAFWPVTAPPPPAWHFEHDA